MVRTDEREPRILDAAAELFIRYGYDKTTVGEIAAAAGISKGAIYLHFESKDDLFAAVLSREMLAYGKAWLERIEADPEGGTIGGMYKNVVHALNASPLMTAMLRQDQRILGSYLRKPGNLFETRQARSMRAEFIKEMQEGGVVRRDLDAAPVAHIIDMLGYGLVSMGDIKPAKDIPPLKEIIETLGVMLNRALSPDGGADSEAGKAILRRAVGAASEYLDGREYRKTEVGS